jgi:hypothetical protein
MSMVPQVSVQKKDANPGEEGPSALGHPAIWELW